MTRLSYVLIGVCCALLCLVSSLIFWPQIDLAVSGSFYSVGKGFSGAVNPFFLTLHAVANYGARLLGVLCAVGLAVSFLRRKVILGLDAKSWLFLFLGLLLGPALVANAVLKDHWGRARPREVTEFGGTHVFSPALEPQANPRKNGSFVAGDPAFGFYLTSFAYVAPNGNPQSHRRKKQIFWGGIAIGALFGLARIAMGGHFLSDVLFSSFFMLAVGALLHMAMFGRKATATNWRDWFFLKSNKSVTRG